VGSNPPIAIRVTRRYAVSAERVFAAWLDPTMIGKFMFGSHLRDETVLHLNVDALVGGAFSFSVRRQNMVIDHVGTYSELVRPRRLALRWSAVEAGSDPSTGADSRVTIDIVPQGGGCDLTLTHEFPAAWADYAQRTKTGWTTMTNALADAFA
jgi:uncharacterized protein YndB with AHSA1/START domain